MVVRSLFRGLLSFFLLIVAHIATVGLSVLNLFICIIGTSCQPITRLHWCWLVGCLVAGLSCGLIARCCYIICNFGLPFLGMESKAGVVYALKE